jgi:hypothetical protein
VLLLASLALVAGATALLVLGLLGDGGLVLIVLSIACSLAAAGLLRLGLQRRPVSSG